MLISLLILLFGLAAATVSIVVALKLVPPIDKLDSRALTLDETRWPAERDMQEEIDALRQIMLQQRLELRQLRRREALREDRRSLELEQRRLRAANETQFFSEQPTVALSAGHPEFG